MAATERATAAEMTIGREKEQRRGQNRQEDDELMRSSRITSILRRLRLMVRVSI